MQICSIFIKGSLLTSKLIYCLEVSERLSSRSGETQGMFQWWYLLFNKRSPWCIEYQSIIIPCWDNPNSLFSSRLEVICGIRISSYAPSQTFVHHTSTLFSCWQMMFFYVQWYCVIHAFTIKSHTIASAPMVKKRGDQIPAMKAADIKPASTPHWKKPIKMDYQAAVLFSWLIIPITVKTCLEFYVEHFEVVSAG